MEFVITVIFLYFFFMGRLFLVSKIRLKRIAEMHDYDMEHFRRTGSYKCSEYPDFMLYSMIYMIFMITKWTYKQFYLEPLE